MTLPAPTPPPLPPNKCYQQREERLNEADLPANSYHHIILSRVGAARKVSPNWSPETMTSHSSNCFSVVWGQGHHW